MSAVISAGDQRPALFPVCKDKRLIDLLTRVLCPSRISLRRISGNCLIPQGGDPGGTVLISKIRVLIVDPAIDDSDKNPPAAQRKRRNLYRIDAGSSPAILCLEIKVFRFLDKLDFIKSSKRGIVRGSIDEL